ncbi:hypothetical protein NE237_018077 [Protea cynaroides]|uniref:C3H1-type domain-containing protein n=1 Tax=Protea cynaroides TaxID=273540 RepID=A0A9Q0K981_9MAGN|nr:hypothetical protein NE237_018077 [Protea cynaroides]
MTESVKKRRSKWDLKVETDVPAESRQENIWPDKAGEPPHNEESDSGWNSPKVAGSQHPRWSNMESNKNWEQLPAKRVAEQDQSSDKDINEILHSMTGWGGGRNYSCSISPGLDAQRHDNQSHSPKSSWRSHRSRSRSKSKSRSRSRSRSMSRSPHHGFKWESEHWSDRRRSGSGVSAPACNDFAAGRCRRGSQCRFLHQDNHDYGGRGHLDHGRPENFGGRHDDGRHSERGQVERWRGRRENGGTSESGGSWGSRHERGSFSRHSNDEELRDYSGDLIAHGYGDEEKHELPRNNRSTNLCNDFLKGKCYRGSSCRYAHHDVLGDGHGGWSPKDVTRERVHDRREVREYDHRREPSRNNGIPCKYFASGNCRNGAHCRFSHDGPGGPGRSSPEGRSQGDRWGRNLDNDNKSLGGKKWGDTTTVAPDAAKDDRLGLMLNNTINSWGGPKQNDTSTSCDVAKDHKWGHNSDINSGRDRQLGDEVAVTDVAKDDKWGHNLGNKSNSCGGPKWSETSAGPDVKSHCRTDNGDGKVGFKEPWATKRSADDPWGHSSDNQNRPLGGPTWSNNVAGQDVYRSPHQSENNGASMSIPESIGGNKPLVADTSAAAASMERYPLYINKVEQGEVPQGSQSQTPNGFSLPTCEQNTTPIVLGQQQHPGSRGDAAIAFPCRENNILSMAPMPGQSFHHDGQSQRGSGFNMFGQSEQIDPSHTPSWETLNLSGRTQTIISDLPLNRQVHTPYHMNESINSETVDAKTSKVTSVAPVKHNLVTSEQVAQITTLSASLAQIFGNGQQLPQLYAALNPTNSLGLVPSHPNPVAMSTTVSLPSNDTNQAIWSQKPYDPVGASIESSRPDTNDQPPVFSTSLEQNEAAEMPSKSSTLSLKNDVLEETLKHESHESKQLEPVAAGVAVENSEATDPTKKEQVNGHPEDMDVDDGVDEEGKKSKDAKGMRMFKFALVECVKEILKPTWKEGQMSKEAHKTIVKKVIDKVTGTIQAAHIPQTQDKIDHYLSYSKPKLTKLVQAYVEKYLKS